MSANRKFFLGDEWLYYKIYSGPQKLEEILVNGIFEIVETLYFEEKIKKFFFTRYYDDGYHLRLRFLVTERIHILNIIFLFNDRFKKLVERRIISKICTDTYNREIERYGQSTIEEVEALFSINSYHCLKILKVLVNDDQSRWLLSVKYFDILLTQFGFSVIEKMAFCEQCYRNVLGDAVNQKVLIVTLDKKYRNYSKLINQVIDSTEVESLCFDGTNMDVLQKLIFNIKEALLLDKKIQLFNLLNSVTHMHFNRFFRTKQPNNEIVIYYLMTKHYKSAEARSKHSRMV